MTLVVGMHLGDSVGIVADSRVTIRSSDGRAKYLDNALKVYALPPYFIVAIAGDAIAGAGFINSLFLRLMTEFSQEEVFSHTTELDWLRALMLQTYETDLQEDLLEKTQRFACVFAGENRLILNKRGQIASTRTLRLAVSDTSFESSAKYLAYDDGDVGKFRTLFSINFPDGRLETAKPGQALHIGSGSHAAKNLSNMTSVMLPPARMSHGDRMAAAAVDISTAQRISGDVSFNGIYFGLCLSCGVPETMLHGFNYWPADSAPRDEYLWEDYHFKDVPASVPFSAGLDLAEVNTGWIYDAKARKRTKLQSYLEPEFIEKHMKSRRKENQWLIHQL